jgi:tetratricopeptide (TPR) repeat protein
MYIEYAFFYPLSGLTDMYGSHVISIGYKFGPSVNENKLEADGIYKAGVALVRSGNYVPALDKVREASATEPSIQEYAGTSQRLEFITQYVKEEKNNGKQGKAARNALEKYALEGEAKKAVNLMSYALSLDPENKLLENLMYALADKNNIVFDGSAKTWNLADQKVFQALEKFKQKKYDECIKLCEEALEFEPDNVMALKRLGSTFYILKDYERAKENWKKVLAIAPKDDDAPQIREILKTLK